MRESPIVDFARILFFANYLSKSLIFHRDISENRYILRAGVALLIH